eukprot:10467506-Alexandrium_andersonii.AAC.1
MATRPRPSAAPVTTPASSASPELGAGQLCLSGAQSNGLLRRGPMLNSAHAPDTRPSACGAL